ncbi:MAG: response regulator [Bacteroidetes bacterium]|jgi:CheY-like chemotaxis protein|nr:response regulator [Bacteroidota bacterium]
MKCDWSQHTILITEDDNMSFRYLEVVLSNQTKINIIRAENGEIAIDKVRNHPEIDVILMDIQLPVMNGYDAIKEIKKFSRIPIIAQTANVLKDDRERCMNAGCAAYISKPISIDTLLSVIGKILSTIAVG